MNRQRATKPGSIQPPGKDTGLIDLDALVLAEIESLTGHRDMPRQNRPVEAPNGPRRRRSVEHPAKTAVDDDQSGTRRRASVARLRREPPPPEDFGEGAEALFVESIEAEAPSEADITHTELLDAEERAFITRAVGFLSARPMADIILERIWEHLAADPDGCFQPPSDDGTVPLIDSGRPEALPDVAGQSNQDPEA